MQMLKKAVESKKVAMSSFGDEKGFFPIHLHSLAAKLLSRASGLFSDEGHSVKVAGTDARPRRKIKGCKLSLLSFKITDLAHVDLTERKHELKIPDKNIKWPLT